MRGTFSSLVSRPSWMMCLLMAYILSLAVAVEVRVPSNTVTGTWPLPFYQASQHDIRTQVIYLSSEMGSSGRIRSMTLNISTAPSLPLTNLLIRLRHTSSTSYSSLDWGSNSTPAWTNVYSGTTTISATGLYTFVFTTPFDYVSGNNLQLDISYDNAALGTSVGTDYTSTGTTRLIWGGSNSANGPPANWTGTGTSATTIPPNNNISNLMNVRFGVSPIVSARNIVHVKPTATGKGDGSDWNNAAALSTALANATSGDDLWVASGTHKPGTLRTSSFVMKSGVNLYGGFAGTESAQSERRPKSNITTLSGDIGTVGVDTDNCYHVLTCTTGGATLDGFTITKGYANGGGSFETWGAGMFINGSNINPVISQCVFINNSATLGGAIFNNSGVPTLNACVFSANSASNWGGAIFNYSNASTAITWSNLLFQGNSASNNGGAIANQAFSTVNLINSTFYGNSSSNGGALFCTGSAGDLRNCIFWANTASTNRQVDTGGATMTANSSVFDNGSMLSNVTNTGGSNQFSDPSFFNTSSPAGADGIFGTYDDGLNLGFSSPYFDNGVSGAPTPSADLAGRARPLGSGIDRGAYERPTPPIIYVNASAGGTNTGGSWANAFTDLQTALNSALSGDQIWVAQGTYKPTTVGDRNVSFQLANGVRCYGGFSGNPGTEGDFTQRDWKVRLTVLSGEINTGVITDNSQTVVQCLGSNVLDGFIIRDAYTTGNVGAGLYSGGSGSTVSNCAFLSNSGYVGGAIADNGSTTIDTCWFVSNTASLFAGGVYCYPSSATAMKNCILSNNSVTAGTYGGGAIGIDSSSAPVFTNCTFNNNRANGGGGRGGAIYAFSSASASANNCIFWGDTANTAGTNEIYVASGTISASNCDFQTALPAGVNNVSGCLIDKDPLFFNSASVAGADGRYGTADDGLFIHPESPCLNAGTISGTTTLDAVGKPRYVGTAPDLGAYEIQVAYVDPAATAGAADGSSWSNAYTSLSAAIAAAAGPQQIWVRYGTYKPTTGNDRNSSFQLKSGLALYGGFAGNETVPDTRDWRARPTVLSGDISIAGSAADNSYTVVSANAISGFVLDGFIIRDGNGASFGGGMNCAGSAGSLRRCAFVANTATYGAGLWNANGNLAVLGCAFVSNTSTGHGAAVFNQGGSGGTFTNCVFANNVASGPYAGAVQNEGLSVGTTRYINCTFSGNSAPNGFGGAIYNYGSGAPALTNCIFWGNTASTSATNQIANDNGGSSSATFCVFQSGIPSGTSNGLGNITNADPLFANAADPIGLDNMFGTADDGLMLSSATSPTSPCLNSGTATGAPSTDFIGRSRVSSIDIGAYERVPVIYAKVIASGLLDGSSWADATTLRNALSIATTNANEIWIKDGVHQPTLGFDRSISFQLKAGVPVYGGFAGSETSIAQRNWSANRTILDGSIGGGNKTYNVVVGVTGGLLDGVTVTNGSADGTGPYPRSYYGGGLSDIDTSTIVLNTIFTNNTSTQSVAGALMSYSYSGTAASVIRNCLFYGNSAPNSVGGAIYFGSSNAILTNCTFYGNTASYNGGVYHSGGTITFANNILWNDSAPEISSSGLLLISTSNIQGSGGSSGWSGTGIDAGGNIDVDPVFVDTSLPAGADNKLGTNDDGLRLRPNSPCINVGAAVGSPTRDLIGIIRPTGSQSDMGCYEGRVGVVAFAAAISSNPESTTSAFIPVTLAAASDLTITVDYAVTIAGTATGADYTLAPGTLTFAPGVTSQSIALSVNKDYVQEANETIVVGLSNPTNASLGTTASHTYTITNDDFSSISVNPTSGLQTSETGTTTSFSVVLTSKPSGLNTVTVTCTSTATGEGKVKTTGAAANSVDVTFNGSNWNVAQTVTVVGQPDQIDDGDITYTITTSPAVSGDSNYSGINPSDVTVKNVNVDTAGIAIKRVKVSDATYVDVTTVRTTEASSPATTTYQNSNPSTVVTPGQADTFYVVLNSKPTAPVNLSVSTSNSGKALVSTVASSTPATSKSISFDSTSWNVPLQIFVTGVNDDVDDAPSSSVAYTINVGPASSSDGKYVNLSRSVTGSNDDDDAANVVVTLTSGGTQTSEAGGTVTYTVVLASQPTANVTFTSITTSNTLEGAASPTSLTFTSTKNQAASGGVSGWNVPQTITITGVNDFVDDGDIGYNLTIPNAASTDVNYNNRVVAAQALTNLDNDTAGITFAPTSGLTTTELGGTATFTAALDSQPLGDVTFVVTALDSIVGDPVANTAPSKPQGQLSLDGLTFATARTLTFTNGNWNVPQTVTIQGLDDTVSRASQTFYVQRAAASSGDSSFNGKFAAPKAVTVLNQSKDSPGVTITPQTLTTSERGSPQTFTVVLNYPPATGKTVTINLASMNTAEGTISPSSLLFDDSSGGATSWNTPRTVTVTPVDDFVADGNIGYNVTLSIISNDPLYTALPALTPVTVTNNDDDVRGVSVSPISGLTTTEAGGVAVFSVVLTSQPTGTVSMTAASSNSAEGRVSTAASTTPAASKPLTFTAANWNIPKLVTVTGQNDLVADGDIAFTVTSTAPTGGGYDAAPAVAAPSLVSLINRDDDTAGVLISATSVSVAEVTASTPATYTVVLRSRPLNPVTITIDPGNDARIDTDSNPGNGYQNTLTFSTSTGVAGGWNVAQTVYVYAINDVVAQGAHTSQVTHAASSSDGTYNSITIAGVTAQITDDDTASVSVSPTGGLVTTEAGGSDTFTVSLGTQPRQNITMLVSSSDTAEGTVSPSLLTFTPGNYFTPQTVTVFGVDDNVADINQPYSISITVISADAAYNGYSITPISATNTNNDAPGITVSPASGLITSESGTTAIFTVVLTSKPTGINTATIDVVSSNTNEGTVTPAQLVFNASNWNIPQNVTVTGKPDNIDDSDQPYTAVLGHAVTGISSSDPSYSGMVSFNGAAASNTFAVSLTNTDVDTAGVTISPLSGIVLSESGTTGSYTVVLTSKPAVGKTVTVTPTPATAAIVTGGVPVAQLSTPTPLTFDSTNWNVAQTVGLSAIDDNVAEGTVGSPHSGVMTNVMASTDPKFSSLSLPSVTVLITDNDNAGFLVTPTSGLITDETPASLQHTTSFSLRLTSDPVDPVSIVLSSSKPGEGTAGVNEVIFASTAQMATGSVTLSGIPADGDTVIISDGTTSVVFEFESAGGLAAGSIAVPIGATAADSRDNLLTAISASAVAATITASSSGGNSINLQTATARSLVAPIQVNGAALSAVGMGGISTSATTTIAFSGQPADGGIVTIGSGTNAVVFEFDSNSAVTSGRTAVTIGATSADTRDNLLAAITSSSLNAVLTATSAAGPQIGLSTVNRRWLTATLSSTSGAVTTAAFSGAVDRSGATLWSSATTITVTGVDDLVDDGDQAYQIAIASAVSLDLRYDGLKPSDVSLTNRNDDLAGVTIVESTHGLNFPGPPATDLSEFSPATKYTYTVVLNSRPTAAVTVNINPDSRLSVDTDTAPGQQSTLVFTTTTGQTVSGNTAGWNVPLIVDVTVVDDLIAEGTPYNALITHGVSGGGYTGISVGSVTISITDNELSSPPTITLPGANPVPYLEQNHSALVLDATATVTDPDSPNFDTGLLTVQFTAGSTVAQDVLSVRNQGTGAGQIGVSGSNVSYQGVSIGTVSGGSNGVALTIALNGAVASDVSVAAVQALVKSIQFTNTSYKPTATTRTISMTLNDGDGAVSAPVTKDIAITLYDDPPTIAPQTIVTAVSQTITGQLVASDPEDPSTLTFTLVPGSGPLNGDLTLNLDGSYEYDPLDGDFANSYTFQVTVTDASLNISAPATITIEITGGDEPRPQLLKAPPMESELGEHVAVLTFDPASKVGASQLEYRVVGLPDPMANPTITVTVNSLSNTSTSVTAQITWKITGAAAAIGQLFTFGIIVIDVDGGAATYVPVTIHLTSLAGSG